MALEAQIRAKDHELEWQLHRKDEHIRTLQSEQVLAVAQTPTQVSVLSEDLTKHQTRSSGWIVQHVLQLLHNIMLLLARTLHSLFSGSVSSVNVSHSRHGKVNVTNQM